MKKIVNDEVYCILKPKKQWRFKTEEELNKEFGRPGLVPYGWTPGMNKYFGQPYTGIIPSKGESVWNHDGRGWNIGIEMLTTKQLSKYLSDGTIAKVGMKVWWVESKKHGAIITKVHLKPSEYSSDSITTITSAVERLNQIRITCLCENCDSSPNDFYAFIKDLKKYTPKLKTAIQ